MSKNNNQGYKARSKYNRKKDIKTNNMIEKTFNFKKAYIQLSVDKMLGLGFNFNKSGLIIIFLCFYVGFRPMNNLY